MRKDRIIVSAVTAEVILTGIIEQAGSRQAAADDVLWLLADMAVRNPRQFLQSAERLLARKAAGRA